MNFVPQDHRFSRVQMAGSGWFFGFIENVAPTTAPLPFIVVVTLTSAQPFVHSNARVAYRLNRISGAYLPGPWFRTPASNSSGNSKSGLGPLLQSRILRPLERCVIDETRISLFPCPNVVLDRSHGKTDAAYRPPATVTCSGTFGTSRREVVLRHTTSSAGGKRHREWVPALRDSSDVRGALRQSYWQKGTVVTSSRRYAHKLRAAGTYPWQLGI